ncbi:MAG TPA: hypothetical protein EYN67_09910 [Flavobacteriales bacterium]|nr:hypothetical protein [Flavobacteriales bacterium]
MTEDNTETTQDMDVNSEIHDELLDTLTDDFFQEDLPEEVDESTVEADEELDDAEDAETDETEEYEEELEDETVEEDAEELPETTEEETLDELVRGYQTNQHANKKSIEASERIKEAENLFNEYTALKTQNAELLDGQVDQDQLQLDAYDKKIKELILADDVYDLPKWQEARRIKSQQLDTKRAEQQKLSKEATEEQEQQQQAQMTQQRQGAIDALDQVMPGWQEGYDDVVSWAAEDLGFPEFAEVMDPRIVAMMFEYKSLREGGKQAAKKRMKTPTKGVRAKKSPNLKTKQAKQQGNLRDKVLSGKGNDGDELSFLEGLANDSLG